jgi:predicted transcriptional regulator of viral defense system
MPQTRSQKLLELVRDRGVLRPRDLDRHGIPRTYLVRLHRQGVLERPSRGVYVLADAEPTEHHDLAEACKRVPHAVVCLLSALRFHGLTTQAPFEVWLAIDRKARVPKAMSLQVRVMRFSGVALTTGVEEHVIEGVPVRIYGPAKTVVDCFRYRNKIGTDVALEALRESLRKRRCSANDLWKLARELRILSVMRPYLESAASDGA